MKIFNSLDERKAYVKEVLGFEPPHIEGGWQLLIYMYEKFNSEGKLKKEDGTNSILVAPQKMAENEVFTTICGLVINMGPLAYRDEAKFGLHATPWCQIGDWIAYTPQEHKRSFYRGKYLTCVDDTNYQYHVTDPSFVTKYKDIV